MAGVQIKICGVTRRDELIVLDEARVDYAGIWFGIPGTARSLERAAFGALAACPTSHVRCVAVTTQRDPDRIADFVIGCRVPALQLHGFVLPGAVRRLRALVGDRIEIFQVLHVRGETCLESSLLAQYASPGGADAFIVDRFASRDAIGSTGEAVPRVAVERIIDAVGARRVVLAGGLSEPSIRALRAQLAVRGVDVDSAARDHDLEQRLSPRRVHALAAAAHEALS
jgi:phosphoribosylanthranilate isomerase